MKTEKQFPDTLKDNIRERGAPQRLLSDHAAVETSARVKDILKGIGERPTPQQKSEPEIIKPTGDILVYVDDNITFVVYDRAFLQEQDERFIHGFGFFRDSHVGVYLYRIDYDRPFANLTTRVALQMARDNGDKIYDGEGYHDMMESWDKIPGVEREGDYIVVTQDVLPLSSMVAKERRIRKPLDPHREKQNLLIEIAEAKW
jgi:hypothetical protein